MEIKTRNLLKRCLFNNGVFCRVDIPIRVLAVQQYDVAKTFNNLWWRMQYMKLWYWYGKFNYSQEEFIQKITQQKNRLIYHVNTFKHHGGIYLNTEPITLGKNFGLIDGAHRLACLIVYEHKSTEVTIEEHEAFLPSGEDPIILEMYTNEEKEIIKQCKHYIIAKWRL